MVDIDFISAALSGLKTASDITLSLLQFKSGSDVQAKAVEINRIILAAQRDAFAAQAAQSALVQRISDLEKEITRLETWGAEKQRYVLTDYGGGTFACALKPEETRGEPSHRICAHCYEQGRKSILQTTGNRTGQDIVHCFTCDKTFGLGQKIRPPMQDRSVVHSSYLKR